MNYRRGRYSVEVVADGAIRVKTGDWLSKYSAAINDNFWQVNDFGRLTKRGMEPVANPNMIIAGETLYHIPTYVAKRAPGRPAPAVTLPVPEVQRKDLIIGALRRQFHLSQSTWDLIGDWITYIGLADNVVSITEVVAAIFLVAMEGLLTVVSAPLAIVAGTLGGFGNLLGIVQSTAAGQKWVAMASVAYTLTAWTFGDPIPSFPEGRRKLLREAGQEDRIAGYEEAWRAASQATQKQLAVILSRGVDEEQLRALYLVALGQDRRTFCAALLGALSEELVSFWSGSSAQQMEIDLVNGFVYPN
jgi:hypothetical protein